LVEEGTPRSVVVSVPGAEPAEATLTSWRPRAGAPSAGVFDEPLGPDARTGTRCRISLTSRTIVRLTVAAAIVVVVPPGLFPGGSEPPPPAVPAIAEPKTTSGAAEFPPPALESSAKIGSPIVSHIKVTSGSASATGAKRARRKSTARGAGSRRGRSMYERRMYFLCRSADTG
jgi:hypothetical protein